MNQQPLTDDEKLAIVNAERQNAEAWGEELAADRTTSLDYYLGRPLGDEIPGQSQVVSTDTMEVVEWMMPILMRIVVGEDDLIEFVPTAHDAEGADLATKYVRHIFFAENDGWMLAHDGLKDGLLFKVGAYKWGYVEKREPLDKDYKGLSELELVALVDMLETESGNVESSIIGQQQNPDGTYDIKVRMVSTRGCIDVESIPPEELLIPRGCRAINNATRYVGHRTVKTRSDLVAMGLPIEKVLDLPTYNGDWSTGEFNSDNGYSQPVQNTMAQHVEYIEHYVLMDSDGDGIVERRLICTSGNTILRDQPLDSLPISAWSPIRMPHSAVGLSVADITIDIQRLMTALLRGTMNNIYNVNAGGRLFVQGNVDMDALLTVRPAGVVRGEDNARITPIPSEYIGDRAMAVMEMVRNMRNERTGVQRHSQNLNAADLHDTASVSGRMMDQALEKIELIARMYLECAIKPLFAGILDNVIKYQDSKKQLRVMGKTLEVDAGAFREKYGLRVKVGLGIAKKEERQAFLVNMLQSMAEAVSSGMPITDISRIYKASAKLTALNGYDPDEFWIDPASPEGQQLAAQAAQKSQPVNPLVEAEQVKSQARMAEAAQKAQFERADRMLTHAEKMTELELKYGADVPGSSV
jgi:hypothetical protein